jgi:transposase
MTKAAKSMPLKTYAGLDVSLRETAICVVDHDGKVLFESKMATDPEVIAKWLSKHVSDLQRAGIESGMSSAWLWRALKRLGIPVICLDSRHAHRTLSMRKNKTDRNDARGLAELVRVGWFRQANVRSLDAQFIHSLLLARQQLLEARRNLENQLRGLLKALGVMMTSSAGRTFISRVAEIRKDQPWLEPILGPLVTAHGALLVQFKTITRSIVTAAREDSDVRRMMSIPGVGAMTALAFKAAIDDPKRFSSSAKVGPYLGLTPRIYQSGDSYWVGGIGETNNPLLRSYLYEAAATLMRKLKRDCRLKAWGERLVDKIGWKRASIAVSRKMAVVMHAVWRDGTFFDWGDAQTSTP